MPSPDDYAQLSLNYPPAPEDIPSPMEIRVKRYRSAREYSQDAPRMSRNGWVLQAQIGQNGHLRLGRTLVKSAAVGAVGMALVPVGGIFAGLFIRSSRSPEPIVVTWTRDGVIAQRARLVQAEKRREMQARQKVALRRTAVRFAILLDLLFLVAMLALRAAGAAVAATASVTRRPYFRRYWTATAITANPFQARLASAPGYLGWRQRITATQGFR